MTMRGNALVALAASVALAGDAMKDLKEASDNFIEGGRRKFRRGGKNSKKIPKDVSRRKNKLARKARKANRK